MRPVGVLLLTLGLLGCGESPKEPPPELSQAQDMRAVFETKTLIIFLGTAIGVYQADFERLPPETMSGFAGTQWQGLSVPDNTTNESSECLLVALRHPDLRVPLDKLPGASPIGNTDKDQWNRTPEGFGKPAADEILDAYGNPIVYITRARYGEALEVVRGDGEKVWVRAVKGPDDRFYNPDGFQLISLGKNGKQDPIEPSDDIENFKR